MNTLQQDLENARQLFAIQDAPPDCRNCISYFFDWPDACCKQKYVCTNGDKFVKAEPIQLYKVVK